MARRSALISQSDVTRITKGLRAAGFDRIRWTFTGHDIATVEAGNETAPLATTTQAAIQGRRKVVL
jgi:hypothetical protein